MLRDSRSYETQLVDAVRSVNRALGGTYGTSSAIYKNEYNQFEVQLIDAIKGIGRTLSGNGISIKGGLGGGEVSAEEFQDLSRRVSKLESESFFRLVDGNVTLKEQYQNLWVPGWLAAGGIGSGSGGGGIVEHLYDIGDVNITNVADGQGIVWDAARGEWKNATIGGGVGTVIGVTLNGTTHSPSSAGIVDLGNETDPTVPAWAKQANPSFYIGTTQVQTSSAAQDLTGILSVKASSATSSLMEWDSTNNAWHFYGNVYADGWMSTGGPGNGGGGSGGSVVTITNLLSSGTRIVTITIDGTSYDVLAPDVNIGTVTGVVVGTTPYSPDSNGVVTLPDYVTRHTSQTIDGAKTFMTNPVTIDSTSSLSVHASSHIDFGPLRIEYDATNKALHITKADSSDTTNYGIYADGFVSTAGAGQSS